MCVCVCVSVCVCVCVCVCVWHFTSLLVLPWLTCLFQEIRKEYEHEAITTGKPRLLLTAAVAAGKDTIDTAYDIPAISKCVEKCFCCCCCFCSFLSFSLHLKTIYRPSVPDPFVDNKISYDSGWLGVKHQVTYWGCDSVGIQIHWQQKQLLLCLQTICIVIVRWEGSTLTYVD